MNRISEMASLICSSGRLPLTQYYVIAKQVDGCKKNFLSKIGSKLLSTEQNLLNAENFWQNWLKNA